MQKTVKTFGYVLRGYNFGVSHRLYHILTRGEGKLKVMVYGVRKGKWGDIFGVMSGVDMVLGNVRGGEGLYRVLEADLKRGLSLSDRGDLKRIYELNYVGEFLDVLLKEGMRELGLYDLLEGVMGALMGGMEFEEEVQSFKLRGLRVLGYLSDLKECSECGVNLVGGSRGKGEEGGVWVDIMSGGGCVYCGVCGGGVRMGVGVYERLLRLMEGGVGGLRGDGLEGRGVDEYIDGVVKGILGKELNTVRSMKMIWGG